MKKLRLYFLGFFLLLAVPCAALLIRSYDNLEQEAFFFYRKSAEGVVAGFHQELGQILDREERRPYTQYRYIHVADQAIPEQEGLNLSPLAAFPVQSEIPGILGYFQIDPDGSFHTPLLPDSGLKVAVPDLSSRMVVRDRLATLLEGEGFYVATSDWTSEVAADLSGSEQVASLLKQNLESNVDLRLEDEYFQKESQDLWAAAGARNRTDQSDRVTRQTQTISPRQAEVFDNEMSKSKLDESTGDRSLDKVLAEGDVPGKKTGAEEETLAELLDSDESGRSDELERSQEVTAEVDPLQNKLLDGEWLVFFRKVWWDDRRYIQGFVANLEQMFENRLRTGFRNSALPQDAAFLVFYRGELVRLAGQVSDPESKPLLLLNSALPHPLSDFNLAVTIEELPAGPGHQVVNLLAVFLSLLVVGGVAGMYRLTSKQIELSRKKSDFVAAVSHELKTPLASIRMYGEMLVEGWVADEEKRKSYYRHIHDESERLSRLIQNVLRLSELERNEWQMQLEPHPPVQFVRGVVERLGGQIKQSGFEVEVAVEGNPGLIRADGDALTQILINLIDNAIKFSAEAETKKVVLTVSQNDECCFIRVRDFGPGIPRRELSRVFERFYRIDSEMTRTTKGTGIGLALVKMLADGMGVQVTAANRHPGAEFSLRFK